MSTDASNAGEDIPRKPSAYRPTCHFTIRFKDNYTHEPPRYLDGEIVERCIREGTPSVRAPNKCELRATFDGVRFVLVVNPQKGTVITGYPERVYSDAGSEGRWTSEELTHLRAFIEAKPER